MGQRRQQTGGQSEERMNSREQAAWTATKTTKENGPKRETYEVRAIRNQRPDGKCYDQHEMTSRQINF